MTSKNTIPVLFTTYNRLEYTKKSLRSLINSDCEEIIVFDNNSTDGTVEWLESLESKKIKLVKNKKNEGVAGAMNYFFNLTKDYEYVAKVDNDTVVPKTWLKKLYESAKNCNLDIVQAKHPILRQSHISGDFDEWMKTLKQDIKHKNIFYSNHVGGTAILVKREVVKSDLKSDWLLGGWDKFQSANPQLRIAFDAGVEVSLLDTEKGQQNQNNYKDYYKETKRSNMSEKDIVEKLDADLVIKSKLIENGESRVKELTQALQNRESELNSIYSSRTYKMLLFIRKLRDKFTLKKG